MSGADDRWFQVEIEAGIAPPALLIHRERAEENIRQMMPRSTE
jgi:D-serine deaminase-like pyridoxal phosphate-dependent protein